MIAKENELLSPCDGVIEAIEPANKEIRILMNQSVRVSLILQAEAAELKLHSGQNVKKGQKLADLNETHSHVTVLVRNPDDFIDVIVVDQSSVKSGDRIIAII